LRKGGNDELGNNKPQRQEQKRTRRKRWTGKKERDREPRTERLPMNTPPVVSAQDWEAARQQLLVKEKALTRARDALATERRRMP
jgi:hypothetical protein